MARPFQQWLASEIAIVGQADQKYFGTARKGTLEEGLRVDSGSKSDAPVAAVASTRSRKGKK